MKDKKIGSIMTTHQTVNNNKSCLYLNVSNGLVA